MPDVGPGQYIIEAFQKMRYARQGIDGPEPQNWTEVDAFVRASQMVEPGWDAATLFDMSWAYVSEFRAAGDALRIAPMERAANG